MTTLWPEQRLQEVEARLKAATPAPWRACVWDPMERPHVHKDTSDERACWAAHDLPITKEDAEFIAAARTDLADAVAEIRRLQTQLAAASHDLARLLNADEDYERAVAHGLGRPHGPTGRRGDPA